MRVIPKSIFAKQFILVMIMTIIMSTFIIATNLTVFATDDDDLNGIEGGTSQSDSVVDNNYDTKSAADGLKEAFDEAAINSKDLKEASRFSSPFVHAVKFIIAVITACFSVLLGLVTILDLLYLAVPPVRGLLNREQTQAAGGMGGGMGMGMGGMGMGMGRMGMGGMGMGGGAAQPQATGLMRFVSDEAVAALAEATQQAGGATGGMGGMGGMGMGMGGMGMGMGGMGMGAQQQAQPKTKSVILLYAKKRAFAIIMFFVCIALFTSTLFTDLGLYIGQWIIDIVGGLF